MSRTAPICAIAIPEADMADFSRLPDRARQEVLRWLDAMDEIDRAEHGTRGRIVLRWASSLQLTPNAVRTKYDRWKQCGWRALCNRARYKGDTALPGQFIEFWRGMVEAHQRRKTTVLQAMRSLMLRLEAWEKDGGAKDSVHALPGYESPPKRMRSTRLPMGWSKNTLRRYAPDAAQRALRSLGKKAYSVYLPKVSATREGIAVGEVVFFDDEWPDVFVNFTGVNKAAQRPLGFHALDYVSGYNICRGWKPQVEKPDGGRTGLTETDFYWFVLGFLTNHGWNDTTGTTLVVEMGTAAIKADFEKRLHTATGGKVRPDHSGRFGDPTFRGMLYEGASTGNFRYKAPIESWFNLERNWMSALPGATGRNIDEKPEEQVGLLRADKAWLRLMEQLPLERRMLLASPVLEWGAFCREADYRVKLINERTEHELQDWESLGFTVPVLSLPGQQEISLAPENMRLMTAEQRAVIDMLAKQGGVRIRRMSPSEVWQTHSPRLTRLRGWQVPALMRPEDGLLLKVTQQFELEHEDREIDSQPLCYIARVRNEHGHSISLERGKKYLCFLNPYAPQSLQVCNESGAWIGEATRKPRVSRTDQSGLHRLYHEVMDATAPERADVERRAAAEIHRRVSDKHWNARVADVKTPLTPSEKAAAAQQREGRDRVEQWQRDQDEAAEADSLRAEMEHFAAGAGTAAAGPGTHETGEDNASGAWEPAWCPPGGTTTAPAGLLHDSVGDQDAAALRDCGEDDEDEEWGAAAAEEVLFGEG